MGQILTEKLDCEVILSNFGAKNTIKSGPLRPKRMPKNFLNNSKTTLKKLRKRLFQHPKRSKINPQNQQI